MIERTPICFWCTGPKSPGGLGPVDGQSLVVMDYGPCDRCMERMVVGIACIEVDSLDNLKRPPLARGGPLSVVAPTGRWCVITDASLGKLPLNEQSKATVIESRRALLDVQVFTLVFGPQKEETNDQGNELRVQDGDDAGGSDGDRGLPGPAEPAQAPQLAVADGA